MVSEEHADRVVAWHDGRQSQVLCGSVSAGELFNMAGRMRIADAVDTEMFRPPRELLAVLP